LEKTLSECSFEIAGSRRRGTKAIAAPLLRTRSAIFHSAAKKEIQQLE
jgi:hypothetical protein